MQYQLIQDALTSLINCIAISGGAIAGTSIVYKHWMQYQYPQTASEETVKKSRYKKVSSTSKQLNSKQPEKSYQNKTELQSLDIAREKQQNQSELCQLQQQLSLTEEQLRQTQQELEDTKGGLQEFVNQLFHLDRSAKVRFKDLLLNKQLLQATQAANE